VNSDSGVVHERVRTVWPKTLAAVIATLAIGVCGTSLWAQAGVEADQAPRLFANPGPVYLYSPERWGTVRLTLRNPQSTPIELFCTTHFDGAPTLQYGRRVWLPPEARLETFQPLCLPAVENPAQQTLDLRTLLLQEGPSGEALVSQLFGELKLEHTIRLAARARVTAVMETPPPLTPPAGGALPQPLPVSAADVVLTARYEIDSGQNMVYIVDELLPPSELALDAVDQLVIADNRLLDDPAGLQTVRRWLFAGGRLWVMLDRVDEAVLEGLLGDSFTCQVVDRVTLEQVRVETVQTNPPSILTVDLDHPVPFVRVITEHAEVPCLVDGWPAAFWQTCGQGRLLVTTLGGDSWVRPRTLADPPPPGGNTRQTNYVMRPVLEVLMGAFFGAKGSLPLPATVAETHVAELVGYSIPSWSQVVGTLAVLVLLLAGLGVILARRQRLEYFAPLGPALAIAAGAWLMVAGARARGHIPPTTALMQLVQPISGTDDLLVRGTVGIYSPEGGAAPLHGTRGGFAVPDLAGTEGTTRRLVWQDADHWRWENLTYTPGLRDGRFYQAEHTTEPVRVQAVLDENGVRGRWTLPGGRVPQDAVLATSTGRMGVTIQPDGTWTATSNDVLSPGQYLAAGVLRDQQLRRSRTLAALFEQPAFPPQPSLLLWTEPWQLGITFQDGAILNGDALVVVPIEWKRPYPGTVVVPPPLLPYREAYGPDGLVPTGFYDARRRQWTEKHKPTATWLQFEPPPALFPCDPIAARVEVRVSGPVGKLSLAGLKRGQVQTLHTWIDPVGTLTYDITDPEVLQWNPQGRLLLRVAGGDPDRPELTAHGTDTSQHASFWQIEGFSLELRARVAFSP
jgi:hypothetical protein